METESREIVTSPEKLSEVMADASRKGWTLIESIPQEDGQLKLRFEPIHKSAALQVVQPSNRVDPNIAWLELIGLLGFLGIGYLVAGRTSDGVVRLFGYMLLMLIGWGVVILLSLVIFGLCLIPVMLVIQVGIPVWSAVTLKSELDRQATV